MATLDEASAWAQDLEAVGQRLAEAAGDPSPAAMQDFLSRARWDDADGVLVPDETGFLKKQR